MKTLFVVLASIAILIAAIIFIFVAKDFILILASVMLVILAFYGLWSPPIRNTKIILSLISSKQQAAHWAVVA